MIKFEEKKKEAYENASMKSYGNTNGSMPMRHLLNELENAGLLKEKQSLPVVPSFVAEWIEYVKGKDNNVTALLTDFDNMPEDVDEWLFLQSNDDNINLILRAWLDGYQVEKPQLFYLKHIDMSKLDETHDWFILHHGSLGHSPFCKGELPYYCNNAKFTQQEIDSMQTGSYEQIEVEE